MLAYPAYIGIDRFPDVVSALLRLVGTPRSLLQPVRVLLQSMDFLTSLTEGK